MKGSTLALLLLVLCPALAFAQDPTQPARRAVTLAAEPLFTSESVGTAGTFPVRVTVTNHTGRDLSGDLLVQPEGWQDRGVPQRVRVDVPAHQSRDVRMTMLLTQGTEHLALTYSPAGIPTQRHRQDMMLRGDPGLVVLANPPRMRGHLFGLSTTSASGGYATSLALSEVTFAPESGDPRVPDDAAGWSTYPIVIATVEDAEKLEGAARRALVSHVAAGGRLVLVPRRPEDCAAPLVQELLGPTVCRPLAEGEQPSGSSSWEQAPRIHMEGTTGTQAELFGLSRPLGFGTTFLLAWDANAADANPLATQELVQAVLLHLARPMRPHHALGGLLTDASSLRTALDPNESFRPALGAVAILLLLYVFAIGPINFRYVERQGRPTVALLTTPLIALVCLVVMASAAYLSKGVRMRARAVDLLELPSGDAHGVHTRYVSYYLTRPSTFDVVPAAGIRATLLEPGTGGRGVVTEPRAGGIALTGVRGGLWETVVTREQAVADTGGVVRVDIRHDDPLRVTVVNTGSTPLRGAIYMNGAGDVYLLGDLAPGESRQQPTQLLANLPDWELRMPRGSAPEVESVALSMGLPADATPSLRAAMSVILDGASREGVWARLDGDGEGTSAEGFTLEWERRFVFVAARREASSPIYVPTPPPPVPVDEGVSP